MRITYDPRVDALYIMFKETKVSTKHIGEGIAADYDAEGKLAGDIARVAADEAVDQDTPLGLCDQLLQRLVAVVHHDI